MQLDNSVKPDDDNSMSELKQVLSEALMKKGIFGKIQAELRASIFSIFKEKELKLTFMSQIQRVNDIKSTVEGKLMFNLILEALDILGLNFSKSVLLSEASLLDVAVSQNALRNQLNLENENEKNTPVLLQLLKTFNVQDINLEEYIINEKQSKSDSFELFKQKQLNINVNDNASSSKNEDNSIIMTSEMKTEKTIGDFKNRNNEILKKLDSIINLDNNSSSNEDFSENIKNENSEYKENFDHDEHELIEEVSLIDIHNNSLISNDEILKESKIIDAKEKAAAKSLSNITKENNKSISNDDDIQKENDENKENSEIEYISKDMENIDGTGKIEEDIDGDEKKNELPVKKEDENNTIINDQHYDINDPSEARKLATKSLIDDIKNKLENEDKNNIENDLQSNSQNELEQQISIDNISLNSQNLR